MWPLFVAGVLWWWAGWPWALAYYFILFPLGNWWYRGLDRWTARLEQAERERHGG